MKTTLALPGNSQKFMDTDLLPLSLVEKTGAIDHFLPGAHFLKSAKKPYFEFYKVFKNDTSVTQVFTNDFKVFKPAWLKIKTACALNSLPSPAFFLPDDGSMYYGFLSRVEAMEHAKAGALKYINRLIDDGEKSNALLVKYREDHYDDLNFNLTDRNISSFESALKH